MYTYSNLPIYNSIFFLLKDLYERVPKFGKSYKYLLGEEMLGCCIESLVLINKISSNRNRLERAEDLIKIEYKMNELLICLRIANKLNQLSTKDNYFYLSKKVVDILNQTENWKKFLHKEKCSQSYASA